MRVQLAHPMPPLPAHVDDWQRELRALRDYAAADKTRPTILAGDFNASQDHAAFRRILDTGLRDGARLTGDARTPTWPARTVPSLRHPDRPHPGLRGLRGEQSPFPGPEEHGPPLAPPRRDPPRARLTPVG